MKTFKYLLSFLLLGLTDFALAQDAEMADAFRAEGKIYVVVAIILIVLLGLIVYLFALDRKLKKLEDLIAAKKQTKRHDKSF
jgi:uncharacterized membrane protein